MKPVLFEQSADGGETWERYDEEQCRHAFAVVLSRRGIDTKMVDTVRALIDGRYCHGEDYILRRQR